jgi:hypothetical protein
MLARFRAVFFSICCCRRLFMSDNSALSVSLTIILQSGVSSVGGKAGSFMPSVPSLPGMGKELSLPDIIVTHLPPAI